MENGKASNDRIYVLKVNNLHCCNACPKKIRRKLFKIPGVVSIDMDIEAGLVKISGGNNLDPSIFVKAIAKAGKKAKFSAMKNTAPAPIGKRAQFPAGENAAPALMSVPAPETTIDNVSNHHKNPSINSDNHCYKIDRTQHGNSGSGHFSDHHGWSDKVHINEAAAVNPPVALPLHNQFMRPQSQYGGVGFRGSHGFWPRMSEPPRPPPPPMPPAHRYYRWSEPLPYYLQEQSTPVGNAPGHYLFNDENTEGCMIV